MRGIRSPGLQGGLLVAAAVGLVLVVLASGDPATGQGRSAPPGATGTHHVLPATLETVQWGWLDPKEPPKLTIESGDTVAVETMMHSHDKIQPGVTMEEIVALRKANPGGGPHSLTGPIYVKGAEPGDVMEIRILKIVPKPFGTNFNLPGKEFPTIGALAPEFPNGWVRYFVFDPELETTEFRPGITLDLQPFPGTLAVGIDPDDPYEAYALTSMAVDCRVSQIVDVRKGVHCMVPKSLFTDRS
ncbi:MAG TPA: acetamidase/formamidase family protein [Thermodesulfobacteriota bacterium]